MGRGADALIRDGSDKTAGLLASENGHNSIRAFLKGEESSENP